MEQKTNDDVMAKFIKNKNSQLQFRANNKFVNVIYGGRLSNTFRKAVRKEFKKKPFSLPQNIKSFEGLGINRSGNIVSFSKVAKKFQHSFKQKFRVYEKSGEDENGNDLLMHISRQDFSTTISYITKDGKNSGIKKFEAIKQVIKDWFSRPEEDYNKKIVIKPYGIKITKIKPMYHPALPATIMGKSLIPDSKDVDLEQKWNTENGSCFYDYLLDKYGTADEEGKWNNKVPKELRILVQDRERLWEVMTNIYDYKNEHIDGDWSVNIDMIATLCKRYEISCYLINEADEFIFTYQNKHPKKKKIPPIYAMITNQHINPIVSDHLRKSLQHRLMGTRKNSDNKREDNKKKISILEIVKVPFQTEEKCDMFDVLCEKSEETGKTPLPLGLRLDEFCVDGFILDNKKYIYDTEDNQMGELYSKKIGEKWNGTGIKGVAIKMFSEEHYLKSQLTPELYKLFTNKQVKDRSHRGFVNGEFVLNKNVFGFDINKAYTDCVMNPYDDWYIMGFDSVWETFDSSAKLGEGFYYIETEDNILFHGNNIYSRCIVEYGLNKNIITFENIKQVLKPVKTQAKNRFKSLFDKYLNLCDERKVGKFCCNLMTGLLGRKSKKKMKARLSTNFQDVSKFYQDNEGSQIFCKSNNCNNGELFIFGLKSEVPLINNHLPNYIQILDNMNIRQYKMMKTFMKKEYFGVAPIYRKVDMFCCEKKYLKNNYQSKLSNDIGGYKLEIPKKLYNSSYVFRNYQLNNDLKTDARIAKTWNEKTRKNEPINDSSQIKEIKEILFGYYNYSKNENGFSSVVHNVDRPVLMIEGDGGTGKTKIIQDLDKEYKCLKLSFTNKACINIGGTTYHRGLSLNKRLDITPSKFENIQKNYDIIVCEEFSMNTSWIWNYICWLRELTTLPILLTGDWGQARPVEPDIKPKYDKYCFHPVVEDLLTTKIMLKKNYRAKDDLPFAKFLHDNKANMEKVNIRDFKLEDDKRFITKSLCYLNSTRKRVNCEISEAVIKRQHISNNNIFEIGLEKKKKKEDKVSFEVAWEDGVKYDDVKPKGDDKDATQKIRIFTGTPMISRLTEDSGKSLFNNEDFIIEQISKENVVLKSLNRPDDHPKYEIPLEHLQTKFLVAWCLTTHKAQGQTIKETFKIYDWDKMNTELRYTALSRAQKRKNVFIEPVKLLFIGDEPDDDTDWEDDDEEMDWDEMVKKYDK